jgi:hypothetical protein
MLSAVAESNDVSIHWSVVELVARLTVMVSKSVPVQHDVPLK